MKDPQKRQDLINKQIYVNKIGGGLEDHIRNSIHIKQLMQHEEDGLGHITISQLLDILQDLYLSGQVDSYDALEGRRKSV
ncbi:hypothetical protein QTG56_25635 (plasmid) [Rossellomorea sp. AcN35-11]|nr:hypothetical protein [Rossellomorea aquimaris]WJV31998.1 hypothetical protein QTG56_25635 [Rossellomorea sp. AcN35-11]